MRRPPRRTQIITDRATTWDGLVDGVPGREFNELSTEASCCHVLRVLGTEDCAAAAADEQDRAAAGEPVVPVIPVGVLL